MEKLEELLPEKLKRRLRPQETSNQITVKEMFEEAIGYLKHNAINPDNFIEIYGRDAVSADKKVAAELKAKLFDNKRCSRGLKFAIILEAVITESIGKNDWLGKDTEAKPAAPFDDCRNGIDTLATFKQSGGFEKYMGLVMDATFNPTGELADKFNKIKGEIVRGSLGKMKYFESGKIRGQMSQIPKVVIGVARDTIKNLGILRAENKKEEITKHSVQFQILEEIEMQLGIFMEYAKNQPNNIFYKESERDIRKDLVKTYQDAHNMIAGILAERRRVVKDTGGRDKMFYRIKDEVEKFLKQERN